MNIKNIKYGKDTKIGRILVIAGVLLILLSVSGIMTGNIANIPMAIGFALLIFGIVIISVDVGFSNWFIRR